MRLKKQIFYLFITTVLFSCNPLGDQATIGDGFAPGATPLEPGTPFHKTWMISAATSADYTNSQSIIYTISQAEHKDMHLDNSDQTIGFGGGTKTNVVWSSPFLTLNAAGMTARSGSFTSRLFTAPASRQWSGFEIRTDKPAGKPLPSNNIVETIFDSDNANMTDNKLLLHMDENSWNGSVGEVVDSSGNGHHGRALPAITPATTSASAKFGRAGIFNAAQTQYIEVPHSSDFDDATNLSVEVWVYPTNQNGTDARGVISKRLNSTAGNTAWALFLYTSQRVTVDINGTGANERYTGTTTIPNNQWTHLAFTYNAAGVNTAGNRRLKVYVNGAQELEGQTAATSIRSLPTAPVNLGYLTGNAITYLSGRIDEAAIYKRTLSASEIAAHYRRGLRRLKLQAAVCNVDTNCASGNMVGPDNTNATFFTASASSADVHPVLDTTSLGFGRYMRYQINYETDIVSENIGLKSVRVIPNLFDNEGFVTNGSSLPYQALSGFSAATSGDVTFQISNGSQWYYWNSSAWAPAANLLQANSASDINNNISSFTSAFGAGSFSFKAILNSGANGDQKSAVSTVDLQGTH